ncbi:MAG: hypothetical protein WA131_02325 [Desulfitobacteriaceae bacterium]
MDLRDAFEEVQSVCDDCAIEEHDEFCKVNVVLTGSGILVRGGDFKTEKDRELGSTGI